MMFTMKEQTKGSAAASNLAKPVRSTKPLRSRESCQRKRHSLVEGCRLRRGRQNPSGGERLSLGSDACFVACP